MTRELTQGALGETAHALFVGLMAPLVLGGEVKPRFAIGARAALGLSEDARPHADIALAAEVELGRVRVARKLAPIDRFGPPTGPEWALAACLHDLVQSTHPDLRNAFRKKWPERLLGMVESVLDRLPACATVGEALSRHTWFSRLFEMSRLDTTVKWWTGSRTFLGAEPEARLMAWPELRRVRVERTPQSLIELPGPTSNVELDRFLAVLTRFLAATPLTALAQAARAMPAFTWSPATLGLVATRAGRTLVVRALGSEKKKNKDIDVALGRATRALLASQGDPRPALALLSERAVARAFSSPSSGSSDTKAPASEDAEFAQALGALVAYQELRTEPHRFAEADQMRLHETLVKVLRSKSAEKARALLALPARAGPYGVRP